MDESTQAWVASVKRAYPHLPATLSLELETEMIGKLGRWFQHIQELRQLFDQVDRDSLPEWVRDEPGKRQIIPVLLSLDDMTEEEVQSWHVLFVCLSAQLADIGTAYWRSQYSHSKTLSLHDVLNYLPVVFLYVLSSYEPRRPVKEHSENFAHSDGRIRLITWVSIDTRRHILSYLQQHIATVRQGSGFVQRLRQAVLAVQRRKFVKDGVLLQTDDLVTELKDTHQGSVVSEAKLREHLIDILTTQPIISLDEPVTNRKAEQHSTTVGDFLEADYFDVEEFFDPGRDIENDVNGNPSLLTACQKLLSLNSTDPLTFQESFLLGS